MSLGPMLVFAAAATAAAPAPQTQSLQDAFDAASQAAIDKKCGEAIAAFERLEADPRVKPGSLPAAAIAVRKGICLISLNRDTEGERAILAGLPLLEQGGASFTIEVSDANIALGEAASAQWDYAAARNYFRQGLTPRTGLDRVRALSLLATAGTFDDGPEALAAIDEALQIVEAQEKPSKDPLASLHTLRGRLLINRGRAKEAYDELKEALKLSGGLTSRTTLGEVALRGDLALAALKAGKPNDARLYLAYTGAGRIEESPFQSAAAMAVPACGEESGLKPEDDAVVEFGIADDGSVAYAQAVYANGGPQVAAAFSRAVKQWYWDPGEIAKIPAFYRVLTRVELRCSTAGGQVPGILTPLTNRFVAWAAARFPDAPLPGEITQPAMIDYARRRLAERQAAGDIPGQVAAMGLLVMADPRTSSVKQDMIARASGLAASPDVPREVRNFLQVMNALYGNASGGIYKALAALLTQSEILSDPLAGDTARLLSAKWFGRTRQAPEIEALYEQVAGDDRLERYHPLRQLALLHLADRAADAGKLDAAQAYFARTGLTEQQCALIGAQPDLKQSGAGSSDYPLEALRYGFEGWVRLEFDIQADGRVAGTRALIAYPPFVFVDTATRMSRDFRYQTSYRPEGNVACNAKQENVNFIIPANH